MIRALTFLLAVLACGALVSPVMAELFDKHLGSAWRPTPDAPEAWAETVVQIAQAKPPKAILATGTDRGNEVMAHAAARALLDHHSDRLPDLSGL